MSLRLGLCCQFLDAPIKFRVATHKHLSTLDPIARRAKIVAIVRDNADALRRAVERCHALGIGAFRITSQILPLATHPESGYRLADLDDESDGEVSRAFRDAGRLAGERGVRLTFHPDQFVVLNSEREDVVRSSLREMEHQAAIARLIGADVLCLHGGGAAGGMAAALERLERGIDRLSDDARALLALENDDRLFSVADLLPLCQRTGVPLIYDAHHHRCHPDGLGADEATTLAFATWGGREPYMHLSSPRDGWGSANPRPHDACIDPADVPGSWLRLALEGRRFTVDVEAKDKERAVLAIRAAVDELLKERRAAGEGASAGGACVVPAASA